MMLSVSAMKAPLLSGVGANLLGAGAAGSASSAALPYEVQRVRVLTALVACDGLVGDPPRRDVESGQEPGILTKRSQARVGELGHVRHRRVGERPGRGD